MAETLQDIVTQLQDLLGTIQEVAARTDSLVDQAILEEACASMARLLDRVLALTRDQQRER